MNEESLPESRLYEKWPTFFWPVKTLLPLHLQLENAGFADLLTAMPSLNPDSLESTTISELYVKISRLFASDLILYKTQLRNIEYY
jgi:hypothetical protein